jgi:hypothetical protein
MSRRDDRKGRKAPGKDGASDGASDGATDRRGDRSSTAGVQAAAGPWRQPIELTAMGELLPPSPGDRFVSCSVSPVGEAVVAWVPGEDHARLHQREVSGLGSFARARLDRPVSLRVTLDAGGAGSKAVVARDVRELREIETAFPSVHWMPDEELLVVGGRARRRGGDPDHNAVVCGIDGQPARSACVGDGVGIVSTTASGAVWVGYTDEGVFGNRGWGGGPGTEPIGASGWNRFDGQLVRTWSPPPEIVDCYALSTSGEACFVCPYTDWPILRAAPTRTGTCRLDRWATANISGARAVLSDGSIAALVGGYDERDRVAFGEMMGDSVRIAKRRGKLVLDGQPLTSEPRLVGRDGILHAFFLPPHGGAGSVRWYAVELWRLAEELGHPGGSGN